MATVWGVEHVPGVPGRDTTSMIRAMNDGVLRGALVAGVELSDLPDPAAARAALKNAEFVVSLEVRRTEVAELADVVFPVAPPVEKAGTFVNWEGRERPFPEVLDTAARSDAVILNDIAAQLDVNLATSDINALRAELRGIGEWDGARPAAQAEAAAQSHPPTAGHGQAVLATWQQLLDDGSGQDGQPQMAATARASAARLSASTAEQAGVGAGEPVTISANGGSITLPVEITEMPDRVVWVPQKSLGSWVNEALSATSGAVVDLAAAAPPDEEGGAA